MINSGVTILIVEDSAIQAAVLKRVLVARGYGATVARNGLEGMEIVRRDRPSLVISDITMPEMDGYEMCRAIKHDPELKEIPVILLSNLSDTNDIVRGLYACADNYVIKPYDNMKLLSRIESLLADCKNRGSYELEKELEIYHEGQIHAITLGRRQILNFLLSTYENAVLQNRELTVAQEKLIALNMELKASIQELSISEERFRVLVQMVPDIIYRIDLNGNFTFLNNAVSRLGYEPEALIGKHFTEIIHPTDIDSVSREKMLPRLKGIKTGDKGAPKLFDERRTSERLTRGLEVRLKSKYFKEGEPGLIELIGGDVIAVEVNSSGMYESQPGSSLNKFTETIGVMQEVRREEAGKDKLLMGTVGAIRDITDRKLAEEALWESRELFRLLVQTAGSVIIYMSPDFRILEWNLEAQNIYGINRDEALGENYLDLFESEELKRKIRVDLERALQGEAVRDFETLHKVGDGAETVLLWNMDRLLNSNGASKGIIAIGQDITERLLAEDEKMRANMEAKAAKVLKQKNAELSTFYSISAAINHSIGMDDLFNNVVNAVAQVEQFNVEPKSALFLVEGERMRLVCQRGFTDEHVTLHDGMKIGDCLCGLVAESGSILITPDCATDSRHRNDAAGTSPHGHIIVPLVVRGEVIGVLNFYMPVDNPVDESVKKMFITIGEHVGIAVENAKLFEQTKTLSLQDPLTGLANRRFMDIMLKRAVQDAKRDGTFSIIMLDLDFFKNFNDTHGHPEGDSLLKRVGYLLSQEIRTTDVAARFGGEEFLVMLPGAERETACQIAERLRSSVENNTPVTMSLGVSVYKRDLPESEKELVKRADAALYRAKRGGRNRVEVAE